MRNKGVQLQPKTPNAYENDEKKIITNVRKKQIRNQNY